MGLGYAKNPPLDLRHRPFSRSQLGIKELLEPSFQIGVPHPLSDREGVMLIGAPPLAHKTPAPQGGVDLRYHRPLCRDVPAVEGPEMNPIAQLLAKVA